MSREALRAEILRLVDAYHQAEVAERKPYAKGDRIPYASRVYDAQERALLVDSALDFWLTASRFAERFEREFAAYVGVRFAYAVNSGSSANLLAFMALTSPLLGDRAVKRGDEVIGVAATFPTTVAPIIQYGAIPVFVDVTFPHCNIDVSALEKARSSKTKAVFIAHTLGMPFDLAAVQAFCRQHGLWLIEDNCDALGAEYDDGTGFRKTGSFGDIGTSSFYPAHHMTMGEGGAVYTNDQLLARILLSLRDWGRDCTCPSGRDNTCGRRFDGQYGTLPRGYDHKYVYSHLGYNLKITDMQAAVGCAQLAKVPGFVEARRRNWQALHEGLAPLKKWIVLPEEPPHARSSPFGFLMTLQPSSPVSRDRLVRALESKGIQTRMLFAGNLLRHPCFQHLVLGKDYRVAGALENTDRILRDTFWVGVYPGLDEDRISAMTDAIVSGIASD